MKRRSGLYVGLAGVVVERSKLGTAVPDERRAANGTGRGMGKGQRKEGLGAGWNHAGRTAHRSRLE